MEKWKQIKNTNYSISSLGKVRRDTKAHGTYVGKIRKPSLARGYEFVKLHGKSIYVHRLVAMAFIGEPPFDKKYCCHIDEDPRNNSLQNLGWFSQKENMAHRLKHGTDQRGEKNTNSRLNEQAVIVIKYLRNNGVSLKRLATAYNVHINTIQSIACGRSWGWVNL